MAFLAHKSLRLKVTLMLMLTAGMAVIISAVCFLTFQVISLRHAAANDLRSLGAILAYNANSSVAFGDGESATKILGGLKDRKHVTAARLYRADGALLASYPPGETRGQEAMALEKVTEKVGLDTAGRLVLTRFVPSEDGHPVGVLYLEMDQGDLVGRVIWTGLVLSVMVLLLGLVAFFFASWFQGVLTRPILGLVEVVAEVSASQNYGLRAVRDSEDELGLLVGSINTMLARIQDQDARLAHHRENLEREVSQRTSELVQANSDLQAAKDRAEASSRAKSSFLANMSHELRTPLNAILLYSEIIKNEAEDHGVGEILADAGRVEAAGLHLLNLISDILDLAKIESGKMSLVNEPFQVRGLLEEVLATVENLAAVNGNTTRLSCAPHLDEMVADPTKVRQVLLNLLGNACKFTHDGIISLDARLETVPGSDAPWVALSVTDTGIGIPAEQQDRIFSEFIQGDDSTTRRFGGTGLGLSLSRKFCQMMGGDVRVESVPGQGATFTMIIPLRPRPKAPAEPVVLPPPQLPSGKSVLLVDDDPSLLDSLSRLLVRDGYTVHCAPDGEGGLLLARERRPGIILLDVILPGMDGWEVLARLKGDPELASIPVAMLTILDETSAGMAKGAVEFLNKPLDRTQLKRVLARHLPG